MTGPARETQPERTALAWQRTAAGVLAVAALMGHRAVIGGSPWLLLPAGACGLVGVALAAGVGATRDRRVRDRVDRDDPVVATGPAGWATAAVVLVAVAAAASVLLARLP